jgi:hypothetical protein
MAEYMSLAIMVPLVVMAWVVVAVVCRMAWKDFFRD